MLTGISREFGFLPAALMTFKANKRCKDYHDNMNTLVFIEWLETMLFSALAALLQRRFFWTTRNIIAVIQDGMAVDS